MVIQHGFWDIEPVLERTLRRRSDPAKGGRPGFDVVLKFKMLVLQSLHGLALQQTSYLVRDRLSWMRRVAESRNSVLKPRISREIAAIIV